MYHTYMQEDEYLYVCEVFVDFWVVADRVRFGDCAFATIKQGWRVYYIFRRTVLADSSLRSTAMEYITQA